MKENSSFWLFKSEPSTFSIEHLKAKKASTSSWDGVRNYQARNFMKQMKKGELGFFYHSSCPEPGIFGIVSIVREAYIDHTCLDPKSEYYDPKSSEEAPRWFMVDVKLEKIFKEPILLSALRENSKLASMILLKRGNRLSVLPVTKKEWQEVLGMSLNP